MSLKNKTKVRISTIANNMTNLKNLAKRKKNKLLKAEIKPPS